MSEDYTNREAEIWILTYARFHRQDYLISERELIEKVPQELLETLPSRNHLLKIAWDLVRAELLDNRHGHNFEIRATISDEGVFQFRKHLAPLYSKRTDSKFVESILTSTDGNDTIRKKFREFFKTNKDSSRNEFDSRLTDLMWALGKEAIVFLAKLAFMALSGQ